LTRKEVKEVDDSTPKIVSCLYLSGFWLMILVGNEMRSLILDYANGVRENGVACDSYLGKMCTYWHIKWVPNRFVPGTYSFGMMYKHWISTTRMPGSVHPSIK